MSQAPDQARPPAVPERLVMPIFPLPDVVLFPGVVVPLHVFEERYRRLVADVLAGDRRFGLAVLRPGWQVDYAGRPPVYPLVGYGVVEAALELPDGRFQIQVRGEGKGRILSEEPGGPYRRVILAREADAPAGPALAAWVETIAALLPELFPRAGGGDGRGRAVRDLEFVHLVASELALAPEEKLGLLALSDPLERAQQVAAWLEHLKDRRQALAAHRPGRGDPELN